MDSSSAAAVQAGQRYGEGSEGTCERGEQSPVATSSCRSGAPCARTSVSLGILAAAALLLGTLAALSALRGEVAFFSAVPGEATSATGSDMIDACSADPVRASYIDANKEKPDQVVELVATVRDYHLQGADGSIDALYRTRTWCDGSKSADTMCEGLGIFGPTITVRPGDWLRIKIRNELYDNVTESLGPKPPTLEQWYALANNVSGRYAGLQGCGFEFFGKLPSSPEGFKRDHTNMPGHDRSGFEGTNIHVHGLEVIPHLFEPVGTGAVDAKMIRTHPGECKTYDFQIPLTQSAGGTFWYHPHMHSSVAIQAWSGMAGLLKVEGPLDDLLKKHGVVQDLPFAIWDPHFRIMEQKKAGDSLRKQQARQLLLGPREALGTDYFLNAQTDQSLVYYLVNAEVQPTFRMRPGETIRLRVLCATTENLAGFEILDTSTNKTLPFWQVASDGIVYKAPVQRSRLVLAGGMREEILVSLPKPGRYQVVSRGLSKIQFFCTGPADAVLAHLDVQGEAWPTPLDVAALPLQPPKQAIQVEEIVESRTLTLSMKADRSRVPFPQFMQNGKPYNESEVEFRCKAGTAEEWIVLNPDVTMHPIHLHVAPFQVKEVSSPYMTEEPAMQALTELNTSLDNWRDTVVVPSKGFVKLWVRWGAWKGKTVAHCHFLAHEDTGMIMNVLVE
mmetsp:Transcript_32502/g.76355  ORF Transcript_32502/g.76355 Transcript_32502/m.76355 type:complete len:674 (-) Transcript_32502:319-2340(-)